MPFLPETPGDSASLALFKRHYGFVPRIFRAQMARPDLVESEAKLVETLLFRNGALTRLQKEFILLVVSGANQNSYLAAIHSKTLQFLGVKQQDADLITIDH